MSGERRGGEKRGGRGEERIDEKKGEEEKGKKKEVGETEKLAMKEEGGGRRWIFYYF